MKPPKNVESVGPLKKRVLLKKVSSVFDPMGLFAPIMLDGKVLLQRLWDRLLEWDDNINDPETIQRWSAVEQEI